MTAEPGRSVFAEGDLALFVDSKERRYLVRLVAGGELQLHTGTVTHEELLGSEPGNVVRTSRGSRLLVTRPTLADYILKMPRGAQVIYPKDLGPIAVAADLSPGLRILEAGVGSGALSLLILRLIGETGTLISYDTREDHASRALQNIEGFMGSPPVNHQVRIGDVIDVDGEEIFDRLLLDLPDPWRVIPALVPRLSGGGIALCYLPTIPQVSSTVETMRDCGFGMIEAVEILSRTWHVEGQSVRPDHRMVGHTGFLVYGRKLASPDVESA